MNLEESSDLLSDESDASSGDELEEDNDSPHQTVTGHPETIRKKKALKKAPVSRDGVPAISQ